jgi:hypothetical protein
MQLPLPLWLMNWQRESRHPSVCLQIQILNKIRMFQQVKISNSTSVISNRPTLTPVLLYQGLQLPDLPHSQVTSSSCLQKIWFSVPSLMSHLSPFPVWSLGASLLFCLSNETLSAACSSVYLIIHNKNINSLYKFTYSNHRMNLCPHFSKIDSNPVCTVTFLTH